MTAYLSERSRGRDNHFNLIRMIAATGVLVSHAYPLSLGPEAIQPLETILHGMTLGHLCVVVFFVISGFFIAKSFDRSDSIGRFLAARALRLVPGLAVVLCLTVLVAGLSLTTAPSSVFWAEAPVYVIRNLTLVRLDYDLPGVFEANPYGPPINGSLWTLFYEVVCYGGVFIAGLAGALRMPRLVAAGLLVVMGAHLLAPWMTLPGRVENLIDLGLPFALGTAMYVWRDRVPLRGALFAGLAALAVLAWWTPVFQTALVLALSYAIMLLGLARMPALLPYNRLGDYSYGMYIYAFPFQQLVASFGVTDPLAGMALAVVPTFMCAVASWHLVEEPALTLVPDRIRPAVRKAAP